MTKLAVLFFAALAFQASVAVPRYYEDGTLFKYLDEIKFEVKDLTVYFENDFPEHLLAIKTVTWECNKLIEIVENVIRKLHKETFLIRTDDRLFKDVTYALEEVVEVLRRVTVYHDVSNVHELKKTFILSIHTIMERLEKLVTLTHTYNPEFRFTLKYLLVDVLTSLHGIRSHFIHINEGFEVVHEPRYLTKRIHEYTIEFTNILKDFTHITQVKVALRGYLMYVREIVRVLEERETVEHKELDVVLHHLTDKLRKIVFSLMNILEHDVVDVKVVKTEIITHVLELVHIFEQLVQLCEDKVLPEHLTLFLVRIIYHYYHAVKHVSYEIMLGYKIGFYMDKYYVNDFYGKYGFGLYDRNMFMNRMDSYMFTPYMHRTLFPVHFNMRHWEDMRDMTYMRDNKYLYGRTHTLDNLGMWNMRHIMGDRLLLDRQYDWNTRNVGLGVNTHMDLMRTLDILLKQVNDMLRYDTVELKDMHHIIIYRIREFIDILDWILVKYEVKVNSMYDNGLIVDLISKIKRIKMELVEVVRVGVFTDFKEIRMVWIRSIEEFGHILMNWIEMRGVNDFVVKDVCYKFITFLHKITMRRMPLTHDWSLMNVMPMKRMPMMYDHLIKY
ncbi:hypothetical protein FQR65_LT03109 [Abscondita terminalis]|nr:hypothetical protein FQR65_LT03109 [Abscondita terminalis]